MTRTLAAILVALVVSPALAHARQSPLPYVVETERFALRSDARVGLHHFLIVWAAVEAGAWPPYAERLVERDSLPALDAAERRAWQEAVAAYASTVGRSPIFDDGLVALRNRAAGTVTRAAIPEPDRALSDALDRVLPVYVRHWWPAHDARNRAWIEALLPLLRRKEDDLARGLEVAYGGQWPAGRIPVDVVAWANDVGAYSVGGRITLASGDGAIDGPHSLEMVFHEASHTDELERPLIDAVDEAFRAAGGAAPDRFWHDMIFYSAGELTAIALEAMGQPGYVHYGETAGVYARGERWPAQLAALDRHWKPFLRDRNGSDAERRAALQAVAEALIGKR